GRRVGRERDASHRGARGAVQRVVRAQWPPWLRLALSPQEAWMGGLPRPAPARALLEGELGRPSAYRRGPLRRDPLSQRRDLLGDRDGPRGRRAPRVAARPGRNLARRPERPGQARSGPVGARHRARRALLPRGAEAEDPSARLRVAAPPQPLSGAAAHRSLAARDLDAAADPGGGRAG